MCTYALKLGHRRTDASRKPAAAKRKQQQQQQQPVLPAEPASAEPRRAEGAAGDRQPLRDDAGLGEEADVRLAAALEAAGQAQAGGEHRAHRDAHAAQGWLALGLFPKKQELRIGRF